MAKQRSKIARALMTSLATDPVLLLEFIKNPDRVLDEFEIHDPAMRQQIRNHLALEIHKKLLAPQAEFAYYVYFRE